MALICILGIQSSPRAEVPTESPPRENSYIVEAGKSKIFILVDSSAELVKLTEILGNPFVLPRTDIEIDEYAHYPTLKPTAQLASLVADLRLTIEEFDSEISEGSKNPAVSADTVMNNMAKTTQVKILREIIATNIAAELFKANPQIKMSALKAKILDQYFIDLPPARLEKFYTRKKTPKTETKPAMTQPAL